MRSSSRSSEERRRDQHRACPQRADTFQRWKLQRTGRYFANQLDRLRRVDVSVYQPRNAGGGEAVFRHMLFIMTGQVAMWRDGHAIRVPACSEEHTVEFPRFGPLTVWNMGDAEPVTVPRFFPDIGEVNFYMGYGKGARLFVVPGGAQSQTRD